MSSWPARKPAKGASAQFKRGGRLGGGLGGGRGSGEVSYMYMRAVAVRQARENPLYRLEMCEAHPMLLRAANAIGEPSGRLCGVCRGRELVLLRYAFGRGLPAEGKCLETEADHRRLASRSGNFKCRVVEVCCACSWNYLIGSYNISGVG